MAKRLSNEKAPVAGCEDRLSTLPEDVILRLLSFLPSRQAVRTCVLATRWRTLWKSVPALRIDETESETYGIGDDLNHFINSLLRNRDQAPLHECEFLIHHGFGTKDSPQDFELWLRYAISCKVRVLRFEILSRDDYLMISAGTLISQHLTRLFLHFVGIEDFSLDVLSCQSLEVLDMELCIISIWTIFPKSLRHLRIRLTDVYPKDTRPLISAPGLITLELANCTYWTPLPKNLPSLVMAFINIGSGGMQSCQNSLSGDCGYESCEKCYGMDDECVFLEGLSGATNLQLISPCSMECYIEKTSEMYKPKEQFLVSKHLKAVEINYVKQDEDERIHQVLNVFAYHGVHPELINIERKPFTHCFSFEYKQ
ncbi:unnamed protein product [Triticum turgidum subsp. durum]|uniref:F-box domain-containing protein n=1 Tax=Triticum turgidum subsp. durum TaxID=4567 RepID=A0A9R1QWE7_TRITD|nr:unnamed protein product [Triticum turgidum subsp. durum]